WSVKPPASLSTHPQRISSGWHSTRNFAPSSEPASSSATAAKIKSRLGTAPARLSASIRLRSIAHLGFMSIAPRPHTQPSATSAPNGGRLHRWGSTGTTSVCEESIRGASTPPFSRATRLARVGSFSSTTAPMPSVPKAAASSSVATRSLPGGLTVSQRMSARRCASASRSKLSHGVRARRRCGLISTGPSSVADRRRACVVQRLLVSRTATPACSSFPQIAGQFSRIPLTSSHLFMHGRVLPPRTRGFEWQSVCYRFAMGFALFPRLQAGRRELIRPLGLGFGFLARPQAWLVAGPNGAIMAPVKVGTRLTLVLLLAVTPVIAVHTYLSVQRATNASIADLKREIRASVRALVPAVDNDLRERQWDQILNELQRMSVNETRVAL